MQRIFSALSGESIHRALRPGLTLSPGLLDFSSTFRGHFFPGRVDFSWSPSTVPGSPAIEYFELSEIDTHKLSVYIIFVASCSSESRATKTTKTFTDESSLTCAIVQTWTATTGILFRERKKRWKQIND